MHIGRLPRPPLIIFDRSYGGAHQSLDHDHLAYCNLARERQQHAYELVRGEHALKDARVNGRNSTLSDALLRHPKYVARGWVWVYNTAAPIRQGLRKGVDNKILKETLSLNWTGPSKLSLLAPPQRLPNPTGVHSETSCYTLTSRQTGPALLLNPASQWHDANPAPTLTMHTTCMPRHLPAGLTQYVLHAFNTKSPPYHVTTDDIATPPILIDMAKITGHQCVRGRGDAIAVLYETHWDSLLRPTWERERDLPAFRHHILSYWAAGPAQHQPHTRQYQQLRIAAADREIARSTGERPGSYRLIAENVYHARFRPAPEPVGAYIWYHSSDGFWWLGKITQPPDNSGRYVIRFLDNPGPTLVELPESEYNTALHAPCGTWCLQTHGRSNPLLGVLHG